MERVSFVRRNINEVLPATTVEKWVKAKKWEGDSILRQRVLPAGNEVVDHISQAVIKQYFSDRNGWGSAIHKHLSVSEEQDTEGSRKKEKSLLYWTIERGDKKIHLPVIALHNQSGKGVRYTRYAVDNNGDIYPMGGKWVNGGEYDLARMELVRLDEETKKPINLLSEHGFVNQGEIPPIQLQVSFGESEFIGENHYEYKARKGDDQSSLKGLTWKLEKHTATKILPQFVIEDLKLLTLWR